MLIAAQSGSGALLGTNPPAQPLTMGRVTALPVQAQSVWRTYLEVSAKQAQADREFFATETRSNAASIPPPPAENGRKRLPLDQTPAWYRAPEGQRVADIVLSFQTPAGGWSKNLDLTIRPRLPGEPFNGERASIPPGIPELDRWRNAAWNYVGTFDNGATTTQLRFLARIVAATRSAPDSPRVRAFLHGMNYILAAQFPNGGWPQVWPLQGGYHDAITYNDDAMIRVLELLAEAAEGADDFGFVPEATRSRAAEAVRKGIECILVTQVVVNGKHTVWGQQHDALTLQPTSARNYEMPAQAAGESARILTFLMSRPNPDDRMVSAIHAAAAWFEKTGLRDVAFRAVGDEGRLLVPTRGARPLWARFYEIGSDRPIFGDRDRTLHDSVGEISRERRDGYAWFTEAPERPLRALRARLRSRKGPATRDFVRGRDGETGASPQRAVTVEPTKASRKRPVARRVFAGKAAWLRCSSVTDP